MCFLLSCRSNNPFIRLLHFSLLLFCGGVVRSQLDFFVNSGEEESTQAPFLTLDVEVQEEVPNGDLHEVPNGDLHDVSTGDTHEAEHGSELGDPLAENATSETEEVEALIEGEGSQTQLRLRLRLKTQFRQKVKAQLCCPSLATLILVSSWEHR